MIKDDAESLNSLYRVLYQLCNVIEGRFLTYGESIRNMNAPSYRRSGGSFPGYEKFL